MQLLNSAGDFIFDFDENIKSNSLWAETGESLPWQAFLTPSSPNKALIEFGF